MSLDEFLFCHKQKRLLGFFFFSRSFFPSSFSLFLPTHPSVREQSAKTDRVGEMNYEFCLVILSVSRCC